MLQDPKGVFCDLPDKAPQSITICHRHFGHLKSVGSYGTSSRAACLQLRPVADPSLALWALKTGSLQDNSENGSKQQAQTGYTLSQTPRRPTRLGASLSVGEGNRCNNLYFTLESTCQHAPDTGLLETSLRWQTSEMLRGLFPPTDIHESYQGVQNGCNFLLTMSKSAAYHQHHSGPA